MHMSRGMCRSRPWRQTARYMFITATGGVALPALVEVLGVRSIVPRVVLTAGAAGILCGAVLPHVFVQAGRAWYYAGAGAQMCPWRSVKLKGSSSI
jgi:hypothetical protein